MLNPQQRSLVARYIGCGLSVAEICHILRYQPADVRDVMASTDPATLRVAGREMRRRVPPWWPATEDEWRATRRRSKFGI